MTSEVLELDTKTTESDLRTGVSREERERLAEHLNRMLASTYTLYVKTHVYHWNVTGPLFYSVHKLTDDQYHDLAPAIDTIAERVRALGFPTHGGLETFRGNSCIADVPSAARSTHDMIRELAADHQKIAREMRQVVALADKVEDVATADLLTARIAVHEEAAWMLCASVAE